jgi:hypothetical protein
MTADLEDRLRRAARDIEASAVLPDDVLTAVAKRRRRNGAFAVAGSAALAASVVASGVLIASIQHGDHAHRSASGIGRHHHGIHRGSSTTSHKPPMRFPLLPTPAPPPASSAPKTFYGLVGAGGERLAVVSSQTGQVLRYLQDKGSQWIMTFNTDRTIAYQPDLHLSTCAKTWTAIDLKNGNAQPAFTDLNNPDEVALSPDQSRIAYTSIGPQKTIRAASGPMPAGCPTARRTLVILDQTSGRQTTIPLGHASGGAVFPTFDNAGNLLALKWQGRIQVLDLANGASLSTASSLPQTSGCNQGDPAFRAGTDQVMVAADCKNGAELDGYSQENGTWTQTYHRVVATEPHAFQASFNFDPSGTNLIYSVDVGDTSNQGAVFVPSHSAPRKIAEGIYQVAW